MDHMDTDAPDLNHTSPTRPAEKMNGVVHLPRMLDKARAKQAGTLGEYQYPCPLDQQALAFLELDADTWLKAAGQLDNTAMARWVDDNAAPRSDAEKQAFAEHFLSQKPEGETEVAQFRKMVDEIEPGRDDITTWVGLINLDEGR